MRFFVIIFLVALISCSNLTDSQNLNSETDSSFNSFILQFGFNPDFQKLRIKFPLKYDSLGSEIIREDSWIHDRLYVDLEAITDISNGLKEDENSDERVFTWIHTNTGINKNYYFKKVEGQWLLTKIDIKKRAVDSNQEDFYSFLSNFCKDSIFQKQRIKFPLDITYLDNDFNEVKENRNKEKWRFTRFYYDCDSIAKTYHDYQLTFKATNERILKIVGVENGINARFTFRRIDNKWVMTKYEDYST